MGILTQIWGEVLEETLQKRMMTYAEAKALAKDKKVGNLNAM